ncbi:conserved hypothetical protein [Ricinus communis]|uniref:Uncharacterized protein n=1 Tax=Ricinus communis TaxID=3988 RepID=B9SFG3_RICCO|nr:conserved hypothetical protein [Ricinus communis]
MNYHTCPLSNITLYPYASNLALKLKQQSPSLSIKTIDTPHPPFTLTTALPPLPPPPLSLPLPL